MSQSPHQKSQESVESEIGVREDIFWDDGSMSPTNDFERVQGGEA